MQATSQFKIHTNYLRDLLKHPLPEGQSAENIDRESGKCNNFNYRSVPSSIKYIVQHHTVADFPRTIDIFTKKTTSSHYVIDKTGIIEEFVNPNFRAFHAGIGNLYYDSKLNPKLFTQKNDMNSWSIGIENVNNAREAYPFVQIQSNLMLCDKLCVKKMKENGLKNDIVEIQQLLQKYGYSIDDNEYGEEHKKCNYSL